MINKILDKVLSGRFISTVLLVGTYCTIASKLVNSIPADKISADFVMGFMAGFAAAVILVLKSYFDRTDRAPEALPKNELPKV